MDELDSRHGLRILAEALRRKGLSVRDAQLMPTKPDPWFLALT